MSKEFEVSFQSLTRDIETIRQAINYMQLNLKSMFAELKELDAMWDGDANDAFNKQVQIDDEFMQEVCNNLNKLVAAMEQAKAEYRRSEEAVHSTINALRF